MDSFNEECKNIAASYLKVRYESIRAIRFCTAVNGNLTQLSYILCNTEPLGKNFKTVACYITGALLFIEI